MPAVFGLYAASHVIKGTYGQGEMTISLADDVDGTENNTDGHLYVIHPSQGCVRTQTAQPCEGRFLRGPAPTRTGVSAAAIGCLIFLHPSKEKVEVQ